MKNILAGTAVAALVAGASLVAQQVARERYLDAREHLIEERFEQALAMEPIYR